MQRVNEYNPPIDQNRLMSFAESSLRPTISIQSTAAVTRHRQLAPATTPTAKGGQFVRATCDAPSAGGVTDVFPGART